MKPQTPARRIFAGTMGILALTGILVTRLSGQDLERLGAAIGFVVFDVCIPAFVIFTIIFALAYAIVPARYFKSFIHDEESEGK